MLGKLLKYEIKSTYKIFLLLYGGIIFLAGINKLFSTTGLFDNPNFNFIPIISSILYGLLILATFIVTFIIVIQRYYKNLFSNEGYLSFTLPVKASSHILSKGIIGFMWIFLGAIITLGSLLLLFSSPDLNELIKQGLNFVNNIDEYVGPQGNLLIFEIVLYLIIVPIYQVLMVYASISIGQLFNKNRVGLSFVAYFVLQSIFQIFTIIAIMSGGFSLFFSETDPTMDKIVYSIFPVFLFLLVLFSVLYFFGSKLIIQKKLNLE